MYEKDTQVLLGDKLTEEAYEIGKQRYLSNRKDGVYNAQISLTNPHILDGEGVCGEFAFAKMIDAPKVEWDRIKNVAPRNVETDLGDVAYNHMQFDVKTTKYPNGHLIITRSKLSYLVQAYALFTGYKGDYIFRGAISREMILAHKKEYHTDKKSGALWIRQDQLSSLPSKVHQN